MNNLDMKNYCEYQKLIIQPQNILEIRLPFVLWNRVKDAAFSNNTSYSWIVRYCVFRMIKRVNAAKYFAGINSPSLKTRFYTLDKLASSFRDDCNSKHRHKLCLYGDDELYIRLTAINMSCSMTHLVRLAICYYIDSLTGKLFGVPKRKSYYTSSAFYWLGIKLYSAVKLHNKKVGQHYFEFKRFLKSDYW